MIDKWLKKFEKSIKTKLVTFDVIMFKIISRNIDQIATKNKSRNCVENIQITQFRLWCWRKWKKTYECRIKCVNNIIFCKIWYQYDHLQFYKFIIEIKNECLIITTIKTIQNVKIRNCYHFNFHHRSHRKFDCVVHC